ncbi:Transcriptional regulator [Pseudomonas syringae pv. maculicola]|nr:Transcriptional regulator [Pseudomonas syringae pv. maculicola]
MNRVWTALSPLSNNPKIEFMLPLAQHRKPHEPRSGSTYSVFLRSGASGQRPGSG